MTNSKNKAIQVKAQQKVMTRVKRIEGQLRGVRKMIEQREMCNDIMTQVLAVREAVNALGVEIMKDEFVCHRDERKILDDDYLKTLFRVN